MNKLQFSLILVVVATSGVFGGALATWALPFRKAEVEEVRAERFVLVDADGHERAQIKVDKEDDQKAGLWLSDDRGKVKLILVANSEGTMLAMQDEPERPRLMLALVESDPGLMLLDEHGIFPQAALKISKNEPQLFLLEDDRQSYWQAP